MGTLRERKGEGNMYKLSCWVSVALVLYSIGPVMAQNRLDEYGAIARLTGEDNPESIDQQMFERLSQWLSHPLPLNHSSSSRLLSSGLFTPYQVASLIDCRERSGDILSLAELALIDGFSAETAAALAPFITFRSDALPGHSDEDGRQGAGASGVHKLQFRNSVRLPRDGGIELNYGMKYRLTAANGIEAGIGGEQRFHGQKLLALRRNLLPGILWEEPPGKGCCRGLQPQVRTRTCCLDGIQHILGFIPGYVLQAFLRHLSLRIIFHGIIPEGCRRRLPFRKIHPCLVYGA